MGRGSLFQSNLEPIHLAGGYNFNHLWAPPHFAQYSPGFSISVSFLWQTVYSAHGFISIALIYFQSSVLVTQQERYVRGFNVVLISVLLYLASSLPTQKAVGVS